MARKKLSLEKGLASDENNINNAEKIKAMSIWDELSKKNSDDKLITLNKEVKGRIKFTNAFKELLKMLFFAKKNKFVKVFDKNNDDKTDFDERSAMLTVALYKTLKSKNFNPFRSNEVYGDGVYDIEFYE